MARLAWGDPGQRAYEVGVDHGVFYPNSGPGVAWEGLISVTESPAAANTSKRYFDGMEYRVRNLSDDFSGRIEAYTYPDSFEDGYGGLSYRTMVDDGEGNVRYHIHLLYNVLATPDESVYSSVGDEPEPTIFSWNFSTIPAKVPGVAPSAHLVVSSSSAHAWTLQAVEDVLYGVDNDDPRLPTPAELLEIFESNAILRIIDHGDGTWTATGPDEAIQLLDATSFQITWSSAVYIDEDSYRISSF